MIISAKKGLNLFPEQRIFQKNNDIGNMMKMIVTESIGAIVFSAQLHPNGQAQAILREVSDTHPTTGNW